LLDGGHTKVSVNPLNHQISAGVPIFGWAPSSKCHSRGEGVAVPQSVAPANRAFLSTNMTRCLPTRLHPPCPWGKPSPVQARGPIITNRVYSTHTYLRMNACIPFALELFRNTSLSQSFFLPTPPFASPCVRVGLRFALFHQQCLACLIATSSRTIRLATC